MSFEDTSFGSVVFDGKKYGYDILVLPNGRVEERRKTLSKSIFGTSHKLVPEELEFLEEAEIIVIGTGQSGLLKLTKEAEDWVKNRGIRVIPAPTPEAIREYNKLEGKKAALIHVTC
ncbi:MAG: Mth938-like domain-containing protein [Candidatus Jordarchaeum sp.]|uniref:Mth938-like domain-containing protein n=1 Tax=Candidatus Jordarchaeum sp. TaxID=2823881 RepID=UPI004049AC16